VIRLPLLAAGLALYFGVRLLSSRRKRRLVRLRDGRKVKLVSSVALLGGSASNLLALEYLSALPDPAPEELRLEARSLVQTVGGRSEYEGCRSAVVTVRRRDKRSVDPASGGLTFTFRRGDTGSDWYFTEGLE
jgi:hypothetical protein